MADVFISYANEDREHARQLANALEMHNWSVWWDRKIVTGQTFDQVIELELEKASCVVVLWSQHSVSSEWVRNEAAAASERGVLVPALIENIKLPLEFRRKQTADLVGWNGNSSHSGFQALCNGVASKINTSNKEQIPANIHPERKSPNRRFILVAALMITALVLIIIFVTQTSLFNHSDNKSPNHDKTTTSTSFQTNLAELESQLKAANILLSTGTDEDINRVRSYFTGPSSAYYLLATNCLQLLDKKRLIKTGYLDMIDKWYTHLVGEKNYVTGNTNLNHEKLKEAMVRANNEYQGDSAISFDQVVESR